MGVLVAGTEERGVADLAEVGFVAFVLFVPFGRLA
jgi:hypothetical protein